MKLLCYGLVACLALTALGDQHGPLNPEGPGLMPSGQEAASGEQIDPTVAQQPLTTATDIPDNNRPPHAVPVLPGTYKIILWVSLVLLMTMTGLLINHRFGRPQRPTPGLTKEQLRSELNDLEQRVVKHMPQHVPTAPPSPATRSQIPFQPNRRVLSSPLTVQSGTGRQEQQDSVDIFNRFKQLLNSFLILEPLPDKLARQVEALRELREKAEKVDSLQRDLEESKGLSTEHENNWKAWVERADSLEAKLGAMKDRIQAMEPAQQELDSTREVLESTQAEVRTLTEALSQARQDLALKEEQCKNAAIRIKELTDDGDHLRNEALEMTQCLPVEAVRRLYKVAEPILQRSPISQEGCHYLYSRIAVFAASGFAIDSRDERGVRLRDSFIALDNALFSQFKMYPEVLQELRSVLHEPLLSLMDGVLRFEWPTVGDALDLTKHKQEEENGEGIVREVKSAVLFTAAGTVILKSVVRT